MAASRSTITRNYQHGRIELHQGNSWWVYVEVDGKQEFLDTRSSLSQAEALYHTWWPELSTYTRPASVSPETFRTNIAGFGGLVIHEDGQKVTVSWLNRYQRYAFERAFISPAPARPARIVRGSLNGDRSFTLMK